MLIGVGAGGLAATLIDLRTRRVPNALTLSLAVAGVTLAGAGEGRFGFVLAVAGGLLGVALMLPGYLFGGTGGGDLKLLAALGTFLGPGRTLTAFVAMAIAGGVIALMVAAYRGRLRSTLDRTARIVARVTDRGDINNVEMDNTFAYAPAIAIGALFAALR